MNEKELFRTNNFDLIRMPVLEDLHFELSDHWLFHSTSWLPGVPIFFFVSGFLISKSYESNSRISEYARNRALRIFPALILCTTLSLISVFATGYFESQSWSLLHMIAWILGQVTIFQFYSPDFIRGFGSGALNGSLWTVTVELQFYLLIPLIYWMLARTSSRRQRTVMLAVLILAFIVPNEVFQQLLLDEHNSQKLAIKFARISFLPWFYMFLLGILAQQNFTWIHRLVRGRGLQIVCAYAAITYVTVHFFDWSKGNEIHPALFPLLAVTVLSVAYTAPTLCDRLLHKNDISYGVYIYHMPIINIMLYYGLLSKYSYVAMALALTIAIATCSWFIIERPAIRRKKRPLVDLARANSAQEART